MFQARKKEKLNLMNTVQYHTEYSSLLYALYHQTGHNVNTVHKKRVFFLHASSTGMHPKHVATMLYINVMLYNVVHKRNWELYFEAYCISPQILLGD